MKKTKHQFGRLYKEDPRDSKYPLRSILPLKSELTERYWHCNEILDQNGYPACVGYGWASWVDDPPVEHDLPIDPMWIYSEAQKIDGVLLPHEGSTVRAGAKVLQQRKLISNYYWASSIDDVVLAVLEKGPVTVGTNWYSGMSNPDGDGLMKFSGAFEGGHCYLINGVDIKTGLFRIKNSWGSTWAQQGLAFISISDMDRLFREQGEVCLATEVPGNLPPAPVAMNLWDRFIMWLHTWLDF